MIENLEEKIKKNFKDNYMKQKFQFENCNKTKENIIKDKEQTNSIKCPQIQIKYTYLKNQKRNGHLGFLSDKYKIRSEMRIIEWFGYYK